MLITLPREVVSKNIELYLKTHTDRTGVVKALSNLLRASPNVKFVKFVYTNNEGTIIVGSARVIESFKYRFIDQFNMSGIEKERKYSEFWSNREYIYVVSGKKVNNSVPSVVRRKLLRVANGLKEVKQGVIDDPVIAELLFGISNVLRLKGYEEYADAIDTIASSLKQIKISEVE